MSQHKSKSVEISCHAPAAKEIFVAGDFNGWKADETAMKTQGARGDWATTLHLAPGRHEYKFVVDGKWCCEPGCEDEYRGCPKCVPNALGTMNRVLDVA